MAAILLDKQKAWTGKQVSSLQWALGSGFWNHHSIKFNSSQFSSTIQFNQISEIRHHMNHMESGFLGLATGRLYYGIEAPFKSTEFSFKTMQIQAPCKFQHE